MDTMEAFANGTCANGHVRVFDWDKAAGILVTERPERAVAGLAEDMGWTGGYIWWDGGPLAHARDIGCDDGLYGSQETYLASTWATPVLVTGRGCVECWVYGSETEWDAHTRWPESALAIVEGVGVSGR